MFFIQVRKSLSSYLTIFSEASPSFIVNIVIQNYVYLFEAKWDNLASWDHTINKKNSV